MGHPLADGYHLRGLRELTSFGRGTPDLEFRRSVFSFCALALAVWSWEPIGLQGRLTGVDRLESETADDAVVGESGFVAFYHDHFERAVRLG
jgi:hypothetical protein